MTVQTRANIAAAISEMARLQPETLAVAAPVQRTRSGAYRYNEWTYAELERRSDTIAKGLAKAGLEPGARVVLMVTPSLEFFALVFALFRGGFVPVVLDPGMGIQNLKECLSEPSFKAFIGIPKAHVARKLFGWAPAAEFVATVGRRLFWGGTTLDEIVALGDDGQPFEAPATTAEDLAAILFTSGSTGPPKGAMYTHGNFLAQVDAIRAGYGIQPGEVDLCTFPLFALFAPALGMSAIIPDMDASKPAKAKAPRLIQSIKDYQVTNLFGSPALLTVLGEHVAATGAHIPHVRRVISAGAPMRRTILDKLLPGLPEGTQIFPGYGATEAMPLCTLGSDEIIAETDTQTLNGKGVCVGKPIESVEIAIIAVTDEAIPAWSDELRLPPGEIGEIVVKGPMATRAYLQEEPTRKAKIQDGEAIRHRMGDLGYLDGQGRVWFVGRKSQRVILPAGDLHTVACERIFDARSGVRRTALVNGGSDETPLPTLCVELEGARGSLWDRMAETGTLIVNESEEHEEMRANLLSVARERPQTEAIKTVVFSRPFPVDPRHNSKIRREILTEWVRQRLGKQETS